MSKQENEKKGFKFDKKQIAIGFFAILILAFIFFLSRNIDFSTSAGKSEEEINNNSYNSSKIMRVDLNDIKEIKFDLKTTDVRIAESNTNPYVEYTNLYKDDSSYEVKVDFKDGILSISSDIKGDELYMKNKIQIVRIFLPQKKEIEKINGKIGAGDIKITNLTSKDIDLNLGSGNIRFENSKITGKINNNAGSIIVKNSSLENTELKTSTGNIIVENSELEKDEKFSSDNGDIAIKIEEPIENFNINAKLNVGNFVLGNISYRNILDGYFQEGKKEKTINLETKVGDILFNQGEGAIINDEEYFTSPASTNEKEVETPVDKSEINTSNQDEDENN